MAYCGTNNLNSTSKYENPDEINEKPNEIDTSGVKSIAVVKKSIMAASTPRFSQLSLDTNLNDPPSNWLRMRAIRRDHHKVTNHREPKRREESRESSIPWMFPKQNSSLFSSFVIANNFPDYVGEVDVVSDAENIKKLLKIPFSNSHISMMVHRIGKTLLLDEFDIHSHLLRASKKEWQWLKKFYYDHLTELQENEKKCLRKNKSRGYLQYKNMLSKFLYHSLVEEDLTFDDENEPHKSEDFPEEEEFAEQNKGSSPIRSPSLASITFQGGSTVEQLVPRSAEEIDSGNHEFLRNVLWTFEDIRMLIGSDLPIFGGGTHPVVSLRLRDTSKPINVLTGLDYWLENLMSNVPEIIMCYHLDGIVQKYELLKTEEIPQMSASSKFNPKVVKDIAQNLLSFLKSKATLSGHTYWLLKGKHDDVVKLYDLTTLLDKEETSPEQDDAAEESSIPADVQKRNPFTLPVAMLLYRVAINMKESKQGKKGTVFKLLSNCLKLIDKNTQPQVAASAHYLLSELYFPNDLEPNIVHQSYQVSFSEECEDSSQSSSSDESDEGKDDSQFSVEVKSLCTIPGPSLGKEGLSDAEKNVPSFGRNWIERCTKALEEVVKGLQCIALKLQIVNNSPSESSKKGESQNKSKGGDEWVQFARPNQSIPLPFTPLAKQKETAVAMSPKQNAGKNNCKAMLLLKALQIYGALGEIACSKKEYGRALQCVKLGLACDANLSQTIYNTSANNYVTHLLGLAGDAHVICRRRGNKESSVSIDDVALQAHKEEFNEFSILDTSFKEHLLMDLESEYKWCYSWPRNMEEALNLGAKCYKAAVSYFQKLEATYAKKDAYMNLTRRLANVCNELGIFYMNEGILIWNKTGVLNENVSSLWKNSEEHLTSALHAFQETKDEINSALLNSNLARLMRLCASACHTLPSTTNAKAKPLTIREKRYHQKAIHYYQRAINILKENKMENSQLWERIHWDLCCTLFTKGTQMQDYPPLENVSQEQVENEIISCMQKALELCDIDWGPSWQPVYQYRAATINHRIGSLYHNAFRNKGSSDHHRKQLKQLAETHYAKAANLYEIFGNPKEFVSVLLKWMSLREANMAAQTGAKSKVRTINSVLEIAVKSKTILQQVITKDKPVTVNSSINDSVSVAMEDDDDDLDSLLMLMSQSLIKLLRDLSKFQRSNKVTEKKLEKIILILEKKDNVMNNISSALEAIEKTAELKS